MYEWPMCSQNRTVSSLPVKMMDKFTGKQFQPTRQLPCLCYKDKNYTGGYKINISCYKILQHISTYVHTNWPACCLNSCTFNLGKSRCFSLSLLLHTNTDGKEWVKRHRDTSRDKHLWYVHCWWRGGGEREGEGEEGRRANTTNSHKANFHRARCSSNIQ